MGKSIILIKLGGSSITDKTVPYKAREDVIRRLAKELKKAYRDNLFVLSHGSGSFAHTSAAIHGGKKGYKSKLGIAKVSRDAAKLNQILIDILVEEGLPAISLRPMGMILAKNGKTSNSFFLPLDAMLSQRLIPVVFGDVIWDQSWKSTIFSGEKILSEVAVYLVKKGYKIKKVIQVGETKGIYDLSGKTVERIEGKDIGKLAKLFVKTDKVDVTGGMKHKVETAIDLANEGISTQIVDGLIPDELSKAIRGKRVKGTVIGI